MLAHQASARNPGRCLGNSPLQTGQGRHLPAINLYTAMDHRAWRLPASQADNARASKVCRTAAARFTPAQRQQREPGNNHTLVSQARSRALTIRESKPPRPSEATSIRMQFIQTFEVYSSACRRPDWRSGLSRRRGHGCRAKFDQVRSGQPTRPDQQRSGL